MSGQTIIVVSTHQARPGKEAELKQALTSLVEPTRKEAGCINYDLARLAGIPTETHVSRNLDEQGALRSASEKCSHQGFAAALERAMRAFSRHRGLGKIE